MILIDISRAIARGEDAARGRVAGRRGGGGARSRVILLKIASSACHVKFDLHSAKNRGDQCKKLIRVAREMKVTKMYFSLRGDFARSRMNGLSETERRI
ncbi:hypothetical protein EVAR_31465_1 [Eumeta japonica]|uniref:Uncharacterized protein n=1 Tax=Eumeta variegata TaxID=151549 RepID=A0A4C1WCS9_EUMVA|nr:hypothetical protein EVAR_31465_1 [Eumeta japonica]